MKKLVSTGELLLRLSTQNHLRFSQAVNFDATFGGSEANVVINAACFGKPAEFVTVLPKNDLGNSALNQLKLCGVNVKNIVFKGDRLGLYFLENGVINRGSKVIYDRQNSSFSNIQAEWFDWDDIFDGCDWFHWSGITPAISADSAEFLQIVLKKAVERNITISGDLNYRGNLWGYAVDRQKVMSELVSRTNVLLAGHYACEQFFNIKTNNYEGNELSSKLMKRFPLLQKVAITNRKEINASHNKWNAEMHTQDQIYKSQEYDIYPVVDRVGAGDSFMGALIYGLQKYDQEKALNFAVAASCLKHSISGDINRVSEEEVLKLAEGDRSGRISR
ncbi:MAG: sugar kinase [Flavobacteriaceae bacterium]|nr:sugar kinase [Flavobacteriaceae bacterium]